MNQSHLLSGGVGPGCYSLNNTQPITSFKS